MSVDVTGQIEGRSAPGRTLATGLGGGNTTSSILPPPTSVTHPGVLYPEHKTFLSPAICDAFSQEPSRARPASSAGSGSTSGTSCPPPHPPESPPTSPRRRYPPPTRSVRPLPHLARYIAPYGGSRSPPGRIAPTARTRYPWDVTRGSRSPYGVPPARVALRSRTT